MSTKNNNENIFSYAEKVQTSFFLSFIGIIFFIASIFMTITNEIMTVRDFNQQNNITNISKENSDTNIEIDIKEVKIDHVKIWLVRIGGIFLMFLGLKMMSSLIASILYILPSFKAGFVFLDSSIMLMMSLILYLFLSTFIWLFYNVYLSLLLLTAMIFIWSKMRKIKATKKQKIREELQANGTNKFSGINNIIEGTYTDVEDKINGAQNIINKIKK